MMRLRGRNGLIKYLSDYSRDDIRILKCHLAMSKDSNLLSTLKEKFQGHKELFDLLLLKSLFFW